MNRSSLLLSSLCFLTISSLIAIFSEDTIYLRQIKNQNGALSQQALQQIKALFGVSTFIESGTYLGDTAEVASRLFTVHTVELSKILYLQAQKRFSRNKQVHLYLGDSTEVLPQILPSLKNERLLFWLDGHWSAGNTAKGSENTPIIKELQLIKKAGITNAIILIDDIRFFQKPLANPQGTSFDGYPDLQDLIHEIQQIDNRYQYLVLGDVLLAYPSAYEIKSSPVIKACTISRLFDGKNFDSSEVLEAEAAIANAQGEELHTLQWLCSEKFTFNSEGEFGQGRYYFLWNGLTQLKSNPKQAFRFFNRAIDTGCNHERAYIYRAYAAKLAGLSQSPAEKLSPELTQKISAILNLFLNKK